MTTEDLDRSADDPGWWNSADGLPYSYILDRPDSETDPAELEVLERVVGNLMRCDVGFHIFVSTLAGQPVLARLAQRVAEQVDGLVLVEFQAPPSADLPRYLENVGRCVRVDDCVYFDALAMAAWYGHPDFYVIK
ncbi:hypothetical protein [Lentzea sp. NPDC059081]|uniref:hypothetical protein n=1 Tax=Lentzea sp. NPDC059081 TaxID=3346719 RepID=UPI0036CDD525